MVEAERETVNSQSFQHTFFIYVLYKNYSEVLI